MSDLRCSMYRNNSSRHIMIVRDILIIREWITIHTTIDSQIDNVTNCLFCFRRWLASSRTAKRQATLVAPQTMLHEHPEFQSTTSLAHPGSKSDPNEMLNCSKVPNPIVKPHNSRQNRKENIQIECVNV